MPNYIDQFETGGVVYDVYDSGAVRKEQGKGLSTNDFTDADKQKLDGLAGQAYVTVAELPTASADTMGAIYLVPSSNPQTQNVKDEYVTLRSGTEGSYTYAWEKIGDTSVDVSGKADKVSGAVNGNFAGLDGNGNLTDSGKKASDFLTQHQDISGKADKVSSPTSGDFATAAQGEKADTAYQKPVSGIPSTDLAAGVIPDVSGFYTKPAGGIPSTDLASGVIPDVSGKYEKPSTGIPKTDLAQGVQDSLALADSALQSFTETDPTVPSWAKQSSKPSYTAQEVGALPANTSIPSALSDLSEDTTHRVVTDTEKSTWNGKQDVIADLATIRTGAGLGATAYQKPSTGIPASDLAAGVIPDVTGKTDKVSSPTAGNFAGLDSNGNLTDSGSKASDFATAAQGALAASAYQKPVSGIPASDLASGVIPDVSGKENTSNKVTSLSAQSTDTQYPSAKATYDAINPSVQSSQPAGGMLPNVLYKLGTLTGSVTIAFATPTDNTIENEYKFTFTAGSTAPTITWPASITKWAGNALDSGLPNVEADTYYEVSVEDGMGIINKFE